ncbi:MAG: hypothetical protein K0Q99_1378, partial [Clostridia bacterium]|nr:hypothetical protein [Clostridia bacterium]
EMNKVVSEVLKLKTAQEVEEYLANIQ